MSESVFCHYCGCWFKYPDLYEEHLLADKSCPHAHRVHHLHLLQPYGEGQKRTIQLDTVIPIQIELVAVHRDGQLRWSTVSVISDAALPRAVTA